MTAGNFGAKMKAMGCFLLVLQSVMGSSLSLVVSILGVAYNKVHVSSSEHDIFFPTDYYFSPICAQTVFTRETNSAKQ